MQPYHEHQDVIGRAGEIRYQLVKQHLFVDARDYFTAATVDTPLEFTVYMSNQNGQKSINVAPYEQVTEVELKGISFPKIRGEAYYILDIPEMAGRLHSSDSNGSHYCFAMVYYKGNQAVGDVEPMKGSDFDTKRHVFSPPLRSLNKITIRFKKHGGDLLKLRDITRTDNPTSNDVQEALASVTLLFEFIIKV